MIFSFPIFPSGPSIFWNKKLLNTTFHPQAHFWLPLDISHTVREILGHQGMFGTIWEMSEDLDLYSFSNLLRFGPFCNGKTLQGTLQSSFAGCLKVVLNVWSCVLASIGICRCRLVSVELSGGGVWGYLGDILGCLSWQCQREIIICSLFGSSCIILQMVFKSFERVLQFPSGEFSSVDILFGKHYKMFQSGEFSLLLCFAKVLQNYKT